MRYGRVVTVVSWLLKASNLMRSNNIVTYCVPALCSYLMSTQWARNVKWWVMALMAMPTDNWKLWKHYCIKPINLDSRDRDRDVASRDRDVWKFGRDETRRDVGTSRDRDVETETTTLLNSLPTSSDHFAHMIAIFCGTAVALFKLKWACIRCIE